MKLNLKKLTGIGLAMILAISGGVSFGDFKVGNVQEVYAQTATNVKFIPDVWIQPVGQGCTTVGIGAASIIFGSYGADRAYIDMDGNVIRRFTNYVAGGNFYCGHIRGDKIILAIHNDDPNNEWLYGVEDTSGNIIIPYEYYRLVWVSDDILKFWEYDGNVYKTGLINTAGEIIVPAGKYYDIEEFSDGYAAAYIGKTLSEDGRYWEEFNTVFIDKTGKEFFGDQIMDNSGASSYVNGIIGTKDPNAEDENKAGGYLDLNTNEFIIPGQFVNVWPLRNGTALVATDTYETTTEWGSTETGYYWNYIDATGKILLPEDYEGLFSNFSEEGYTLGKPVGKDELHILKLNSQTYEITVCGIIEGADFDFYDYYSNCLAALASNKVYPNLSTYLPFSFSHARGDKVGFADLKGNIVIEPIFDFATDLQDNKAIAVISEYDEEAKAKGLKAGVYILDFSNGVPTIEDMKNAQVLNLSTSTATAKVILNGEQLSFSQDPVIENGYTLVPMRTIFEKLGASVEWDANTKTVTATKGGTVIKLTVGSNVATVNGNSYNLDVSPKILNGTTLVPVRFISEQLNVNVEWDANTKTVTMASK